LDDERFDVDRHGVGLSLLDATLLRAMRVRVPIELHTMLQRTRGG
jgi:hypothetical protein